MKTFRLILIMALGVVMWFGPMAEAAEPSNRMETYSSNIGKEGRGQKIKEIACDCCMKCRAATREIKSKENGLPARNGCRDCCERCGEQSLPIDKERIPEKIIDK